MTRCWRAPAGGRGFWIVMLIASAGGACSGPQHALDPAGVQAQRIAELWWVMFALASLVTIVVVGLLLVALARRRDPESPEPIDPAAYGEEGGTARAVLAGVVATVVILAAVVVYNFRVMRQVARLGADGPMRVIEVVGHQYWWEVRYLDETPALGVTTANEIHLPAGEPVLIRLMSSDVIHSLWIPNLGGKIDLVPGRENTLRLQADRPGVWRGQCAEFCGLQHARMALTVEAHAAAGFDEWLAAQRRPAPAPVDSLSRRGLEVFETSSCVTCHRIRGTRAMASTGPDLTHLASRRTLAAGVLPNTPGHLAGWILNPQAIKPGNRMPGTPLPAADLHALLAYLQTLR